MGSCWAVVMRGVRQCLLGDLGGIGGTDCRESFQVRDGSMFVSDWQTGPCNEWHVFLEFSCLLVWQKGGCMCLVLAI